MIDNCNETAPRPKNHETLLSKFLKIQQKTYQQTMPYEFLIRKKPSRTENMEEEQTYLSPSRRKSYLNTE